MAADSDVVLVGTGLAPLVAARRLLAEGCSVLLLNPDDDYFREDSELPLDPLWPPPAPGAGGARLRRGEPEAVLRELRPEFPGAVEAWPGAGADAGKGYRDASAPHVRARARLWLRPSGASARDRADRWEAVEALYVEAADAGFAPQVLDGLPALSRFPGFGGKARRPDLEARAVLLPKACDVDVTRYRNGLLEFVRERVGADRMVRSAAQLELAADGVRYHAGGRACAARAGRVLAFWTPRLTPWLLAQFKSLEARVESPRGVRLWEHWSLLSRDALAPEIIGMHDGLCAWGELEGEPGADRFRLGVLRPGALRDAAAFHRAGEAGGETWASRASFGDIARLCHDLLGWDKFSVRAMRPRAVLEWEDPERLLHVPRSPVPFLVQAGSDGFLADVVRRARRAAETAPGVGGKA